MGYHPTTLNRVKNKTIPVSDNLLRKMLTFLSEDEFAKLITGEEVKSTFVEPKDLSEAVIALKAHIEAVRKLLEKYPALSKLAYGDLMGLVKGGVRDYCVKVTEEQVRKFEKLLRDRARGTIRNHMAYLRRALRELGYELSPEDVEEYLMELWEEGPHSARLAASALKLFIKLVLKDLVLYSSFKVPKPQPKNREPLTLEEVRAIVRSIEWPPAKAYFALLAETGLRPGEAYGLRLTDLDVKERTVKPIKLTRTKKAYVSFFSPKLADYLASVYLPYRKDFVRKYEGKVKGLIDAKEWRERLFPFKRALLREAIYEAAKRVVRGREFRLYDLRAFFASYMSLKGLPGQVIDLLQGREPPSQFRILTRHYLIFSIQDLKRMYDKAGLSVL